MWNSTPDAELLQAAEKGDLNTAAGLGKQVDRLMASPRLDAGMRAFFNDMLELDTFDTVSKDSILYPKWSSGIAASAKEETLRTTIDLALHEQWRHARPDDHAQDLHQPQSGGRLSAALRLQGRVGAL